MSIVLPSSAARNAAASVQLRIAPPDNLKRRASSAEVDVAPQRRLAGHEPAPEPLAVARLREREVDHEVQPAQERVVDVAAEVRGEDDRARVGLHPLQQVRDLDVRVAVLGVARPPSACRTARRPRRRTGSRSSPRAASKIRPRFFSVSPTYLDTIVARSTWKMSSPRSAGEHLRGHRLAGPGLAREQDLQALGLRDAALVAPVGQHLVAMAQVGGDRVQRVELAIRDDEVVPRVGRLEPLGERARRDEDASRAPASRSRPCTSATRAASSICADREPELRAHVGDVVDTGQLAPGRGALAERGRADGVAQDGAIGGDVVLGQHQRALGQRVEVARAVVDDRAPLERRRQLGVRARLVPPGSARGRAPGRAAPARPARRRPAAASRAPRRARPAARPRPRGRDRRRAHRRGAARARAAARAAGSRPGEAPPAAGDRPPGRRARQHAQRRERSTAPKVRARPAPRRHTTRRAAAASPAAARSARPARAPPRRRGRRSRARSGRGARRRHPGRWDRSSRSLASKTVRPIGAIPSTPEREYGGSLARSTAAVAGPARIQRIPARVD